MAGKRSDLAVEAAETLALSGARLPLEGVRQSQYLRRGYVVTSMEVMTAEAARLLDKPMGKYVTIDLRPYARRRCHFFTKGVECMAAELMGLLPKYGRRPVLVAGLGNRRLTADAVGPLSIESLLVTRHLPRYLGNFAPVMALPTAVLAQTGMETWELLHSVVRETSPAVVIVIDALAAREKGRLCATVQMSDTGLTPGSGVGNHRLALNRETLGVPTIAVGVPTVMDAEDLGAKESEEPLFVTPRDIDSRVAELSRMVGYGVTLALQPQLTIDDITGLLG